MADDILKYHIITRDSLPENTYSTPIDITATTTISNCNVRCKLDISNLKTSSSVKNVHVIINNDKSGIPHICIDMSKQTHKYNIKYNGVDYNLNKIIIIDDYLHKSILLSVPRKPEHGFETILYFQGGGGVSAADPQILCISLNTIIEEFGSDFFEQIFGILGKKIPRNEMNLKVKSEKNGKVTYEAPVESPWAPKMIIPKTQTYYKYTGVWPFDTSSSKITRCTWILYLNKIEISSDIYKIIRKLIPKSKKPTDSNKLPSRYPVNKGKINIYKHIDTNNNKLNEDDLVIKCEKENDEYDCDAGDIEYQKAQGELYDASSTCPMTISSKEINTLYKSYLTDFVPSAANLIIKIINVIIYTTALILGYMLAKFSMEHFNGNILFQLGNLGWHACKSVSGAVKSETGKKLGRGIVNVVKHPVKTLHPAKIIKGLGVNGAKGGVMLTPQDKFINQYEINQLRH